MHSQNRRAGIQIEDTTDTRTCGNVYEIFWMGVWGSGWSGKMSVMI